MHDEDEAATGLASELRGEAIDVGDGPEAIRGVGKILDLVGWLDKAEVERECLSLIETVDTCHIPRMSETTGKDGTLARTVRPGAVRDNSLACLPDAANHSQRVR